MHLALNELGKDNTVALKQLDHAHEVSERKNIEERD